MAKQSQLLSYTECNYKKVKFFWCKSATPEDCIKHIALTKKNSIYEE